jgi:hypothetical protein
MRDMVVDRVMGDDFDTDESLQEINLEDLVSDEEDESTIDNENSNKN